MNFVRFLLLEEESLNSGKVLVGLPSHHHSTLALCLPRPKSHSSRSPVVFSPWSNTSIILARQAGEKRVTVDWIVAFEAKSAAPVPNDQAFDSGASILNVHTRADSWRFGAFQHHARAGQIIELNIDPTAALPHLHMQ